MNVARVFLLLAAMLIYSGASASDSQYSANYQIDLTVEEQESSVRTRTAFEDGETINHDFGAHHVIMMIEEQSATHYILNVEVIESSSEQDGFSVLKQNFRGSYGAILEFESQNPSVTINGAIIVGSFKTN